MSTTVVKEGILDGALHAEVMSSLSYIPCMEKNSVTRIMKKYGSLANKIALGGYILFSFPELALKQREILLPFLV